jgi:FkbM family methyltransferase
MTVSGAIRRLKAALGIIRNGVPATRAKMRTELREEMAHLAKHGFSPATIIDVGFNTGTDGLYDHFPDAQYLMVDPLVESEPFLKAQKARLKQADYVVAAAGAAPGKIDIGVSPCFGGTSQYLADKLPTRSVPMTTLDELAEKFHARGPYVIKIDVQGAELEVLKGAKRILAETEVIFAETRLFPFRGAPELLEVLKFLEREGFVLYDLFNGALRPSDGALGQIDITAVKRNGFFRTADTYRTSATYRTAEQREQNVAAKLQKRAAALRDLRQDPEGA